MGTNASFISLLPQLGTFLNVLHASIVLIQPAPIYFFKAFFLIILASGSILKLNHENLNL